ncbi:MAG: T9SS type A sorting domain-containing protein [Lewinellaceae bacterium]|nr:T9SS type A sorting domain-containing protein [Lewinellaceae bacterium]
MGIRYNNSQRQYFNVVINLHQWYKAEFYFGNETAYLYLDDVLIFTFNTGPLQTETTISGNVFSADKVFTTRDYSGGSRGPNRCIRNLKLYSRTSNCDSGPDDVGEAVVVADNQDNCPTIANADQADLDNDGLGDACDADACINGVVEVNLILYIEGLGLNRGIENALTRRLRLAASKFCIGHPVQAITTQLNSIITYTQYQSGNQIPTDAADYIIAQVSMLIDAMNAGIVVCCTPSIPHPANPGVATTADALQLQANPNPFRDEVAIRFSLPQAGPATLELFNLNGQRVAALHSGYLDAGQQDFRWNGADGSGQQLSSGIYLVRSQMEDATLTQKVSMVR